MKKNIFIILVFFWSGAYSQITLDFQSPLLNIWTTKLSSTKTVYLDFDQWNMNQQNQFSLYNLDGTFYKTIVMPPKPDPSSYFYYINFITESLFDNDPTTIEYIVAYSYDSIPNAYSYNRVKVIREDGTILLDEMNAGTYSIYLTEEGPKLMLSYYYANCTTYQTKVFNLPGQIPTETNDNNTVMSGNSVLYPNPNAGSFSIDLKNNQDESVTIELYSANGKLVNTYQTSGNTAKISNSTLSDGLYYIKTKSKNRNTTSKMIIQK
jgi:hypothetical protein